MRRSVRRNAADDRLQFRRPKFHASTFSSSGFRSACSARSLGRRRRGPVAERPGGRGRRADRPAPDRRRGPHAAAWRPPGVLKAKLGKLATFCKFLAGSFSAVSKRNFVNFARKYAFDSIFQALQDLHPFAPLQSQNFRKKSV